LPEKYEFKLSTMLRVYVDIKRMELNLVA